MALPRQNKERALLQRRHGEAAGPLHGFHWSRSMAGSSRLRRSRSMAGSSRLRRCAPWRARVPQSVTGHCTAPPSNQGRFNRVASGLSHEATGRAASARRMSEVDDKREAGSGSRVARGRRCRRVARGARWPGGERNSERLGRRVRGRASIVLGKQT
jgi:hypothetical protein